MTTETATAPCASILGGPCEDGSQATVRWACVHEHMSEFRVCWPCAADIQQVAGQMVCRRCEEAREQPHSCHPRVVIDWDSGEKTIVQEAPHA